MVKHRKVSTKEKDVCSGVIECKPIKEGEMRRQDDSHCGSLSLNFKQLAQRCVGGEIHFVFFFTNTRPWGFVPSQAFAFHSNYSEDPNICFHYIGSTRSSVNVQFIAGTWGLLAIAYPLFSRKWQCFLLGSDSRLKWALWSTGSCRKQCCRIESCL